jgi:hypothetical protein
MFYAELKLASDEPLPGAAYNNSRAALFKKISKNLCNTNVINFKDAHIMKEYDLGELQKREEDEKQAVLKEITTKSKKYLVSTVATVGS